MTLKELINKCNYKSVFNLIYKLHLKEKDASTVLSMDLKFLDAWKELANLKGKVNKDLEIHLKKVEGQRRDHSPPLDTCLYCLSEKSFYALDFVSWEELINLNISSEIQLEDKEIAANILWEITFWGYSSDQIKKESEKLKES
jgi:adenylate cyclase